MYDYQCHLFAGSNTAQKWVVTAFGCRKFGIQIWHYLGCLYCQKQLKMKVLNQNGTCSELDKLQKGTGRTVGPLFASSLEP